MESDDEISGKYCPLCHHALLDELHKFTQTHKFNYLLYLWNNKRKSMVKDRHGVEIDVTSNFDFERNTNLGTFTTVIGENSSDEVTYTFTVKSVRSEKRPNLILMNAKLLYPRHTFEMIDEQGILSEGDVVELHQGANYTVKVRCDASFLSQYNMPIAFNFQTSEENVKSFTVTKEMIVIVSNDEDIEVALHNTRTPYTGKIWSDMKMTIRSTCFMPDRGINKIPEKYINALATGLNKRNLHYSEHDVLHELERKMAPGYPTPNNYAAFFTILLWLEEMGSKAMITNFNMECVTMEILSSGLLQLTVPGLAEKRPSIVVGDRVLARFHEKDVAYQGLITRVNNENIEIKGFDDTFIHVLRQYPDIELDVQFDQGRLIYERMHNALNMMENYLPVIFSSDVPYRSTQQIKITENHFFNKDVYANFEQRTAVQNIVNRSSGRCPFIVFGPPGTGKTITIVEAILQITKRWHKDSRILVCAPSNAACDMLASKLRDYFTKTELLRLLSGNADWAIMSEGVKEFSNRSTGEAVSYTGNELMSFKIVVCTLVFAGRYAFKYQPTHVFIDEAAQAREPETLVAIVGLLEPGNQLVLAGDPCQLGPVCVSKIAHQKGLGKSLLERLMTSEQGIYTSGNTDLIQKLKQNYRSHRQILQIPNELFYGGELRHFEGADEDPIIKYDILKKKALNDEQATVFHCVYAQEGKEGKSPSYFNEQEIQMVMKYVHALLENEEIKVHQHEIGIITPYIRQAYRIRSRLRDAEYSGVEVGTVESFQGRERRIIIISIVRGRASLLHYDRKYNIGFVGDSKRFNVALTRAKNKLIVIGNPLCMVEDPKWGIYIDQCEELQSYRGPPLQRRTRDLREEIINRFNGIDLKSVR